MSKNKVLIVEDDIVNANEIKRFLELKGYDVVDVANSYKEAIQSFEENKPDIVLLGVRLNGKENGVDVAKYINASHLKRPFLFLSSQIDQSIVEAAKQTMPSGFLSKPVQLDSLSATIEITLHRFFTITNSNKQIRLTDGNTKYIIDIDEILFIQSEHVYVKVFRRDEDIILHRSTMKEILSKLPPEQFVQTHRSYVVNLKQIRSWNSNHIYIDDFEIPMSRNRKKEVLLQLNNM